ISDQVSSSLLKKLIMRPRPCHAIGGLPVEEHIRLLVDCGGGFSFPSSHAVNNFAAAMLLSHFYPRRRMALFFVAGIVAFSRISVGVHYPSDVLGGMLVGMLVAAVCILGWMLVVAYYPGLDPLAPPDAKDLPGPPR
ncbi:MAG TPA: phosphatase PAP2 family protein, partial [Bacteroidota bacterium]|nr:phosphatase PAP2 family protein [Bacteroidota bacterium]